MRHGFGRQAVAAALVGALLSAADDTAVAQPATQAASGNCEPATVTDQLGVARIAKSAPKVNFVSGVNENKACPSVSSACRSKSFLMPGDVVLTGETRSGFVCATYANAKAVETSGWLPAASLETVAPQPVTADAWTGTWRRIEAEIKIKQAGADAVEVDGSATWGSYDPGRVKRGTVRSGSLSGKVTPVNDALFMSDDPATSFEAVKEGCAVRMRRIAQYLLVEDNNNCGGINVSFSGLYVKR